MFEGVEPLRAPLLIGRVEDVLGRRVVAAVRADLPSRAEEPPSNMVSPVTWSHPLRLRKLARTRSFMLSCLFGFGHVAANRRKPS